MRVFSNTHFTYSKVSPVSDAEKTMRHVEFLLKHPHLTNGEKNEEAQRLIRQYFHTSEQRQTVKNAIAESDFTDKQ